MVRLLLFLFFAGTCGKLHAQALKGQWKGYFVDMSADSGILHSQRYEYVLDLESKDLSISGFSYTYFNFEGKRYYSICKVTGFIDPKKRYLEVREIERTKTNIPAAYTNCFQVHNLNYDKKTQPQVIKGKWIPANSVKYNDCGYGNTFLTWRPVQKSSNVYSANKPVVKNKLASNSPAQSNLNSAAPTIVRGQSKDKKEVAAEVVITEKHKPLSPAFEFQKIENVPVEINTGEISTDAYYKKRNLHLQKTIRVTSDFIVLSIYDNGEIDGDSISIFFNGKQLLKNTMLTDKPINVEIPVSNYPPINELVLYAENLGSIPPNTALMIITDAQKRYEVRVSCDLQRNAVIHFIKDTPANSSP
jgi:hypothetical protein